MSADGKEPVLDALPKFINYAKFQHGQNEFFMDLGLLYPSVNEPAPGQKKPIGQLVGRFMMTPLQAKEMVRALAESVSSYERTYGVIDPPQEVPTDIRLN